MKRTMLLCGAALAFGCAGCQEMPWRNQTPGVNRWMVQTVQDQAIQNAIVRQQTLYPYHFVINGEELTSLGEQEMRVLAAHYRTYPGQLSVRRGDESEQLYQKRVTRVLCVLQEAGVPVERVRITEDLPRGDGMSSEQVVQIMKRSELPQAGASAQLDPSAAPAGAGEEK
ncbi:MAG TPA: hypothetical protein VFJ30_08005 [Phycisphaerae bacterium]|nr:hypothetical protein [Phycisphaerae bacterium]